MSLEADAAAPPAVGVGAAAAELVFDPLVVVADVVGDGRPDRLQGLPEVPHLDGLGVVVLPQRLDGGLAVLQYSRILKVVTRVS